MKTFLLAAVAACLVALPVFAAEETSQTVLEQYMSENNYSDEETAIIKKLADAYTEMQMGRSMRMTRLRPGTAILSNSVCDLYTLALASFVEPDDLKNEMLNILGLASTSEAETAIPIVAGMVNATNDAFVSTFYMEVFGDTNNPFSDDLIAILEKYGVGTTLLDYTDRAASASAMSEWISSKSSDAASDIIVESTITDDTNSVLLSVAAIEAYWADSLTATDGGEDTFSVSSGESITVPFTAISGPVQYGKKDLYNTQYVRMPLQGSCELACLWTDNAGYEFMNMLYHHQDPEIFDELLSQGETLNYTVYIPEKTLSNTYLQHIAMDWKMTGKLHGLLSPKESNVCSVYSNSASCGDISVIMQQATMSIKSKTSATTERRRRDTTEATESTTDSNIIKLNKDHICGLRCPIGTFHYASIYLGQ